MRRATLVSAALLVIAACAEPPQPPPEPPPPPPPTAAELLAEVERESAAGNLEVALERARDIVAGHAASPEAQSAAELIPTLEAEVEAAAEAERIRAAEAAAAAEAERAAAAAAAEARRLADKWNYRVNVDPMTSKESRFARIESENTVAFDFPYQGPQHATLTIRNHPTYGRDVIISIERGQFLCHSYTDCRIRVRFDEAPAEQWRAAGPSDNSTTSMFLRNESRFVEKLRAAKVVRVQVPVYQQGEPMFEFHVGGFDYDRYSEQPGTWLTK